jgi:hypothetical protein
MSALEMLEAQAAHRDGWLRNAAERLIKDDRFLAAWLVGSLGDGSADGLSDIDMLVVVDDRYSEAILKASAEEVARFGESVWVREVPRNAPPGGAYVSAGFQSTPLPIAVDWYWQPVGLAVLPTDARLLFAKVDVRRADPPATFAQLMSRSETGDAGVGHPRPDPSASDRVAFFWAMVPVAAKYGARGWDERARRILGMLAEQVDAVSPCSGGQHRRELDTRDPLQGLRLLTQEMADLMPSLGARGIPLPETSYARAFLLLAEGLQREGWIRTYSKSPE